MTPISERPNAAPPGEETPATSTVPTTANEGPSEATKPLVVVVIGMAGSGKTTLMKALHRHFLLTTPLGPKRKHPYVINLDPAVKGTPYPVNVDIRDTVNYKEVMKQYKLGPNGAIMTSLNLFATRFEQVLELLEKRSTTTEVVLIDTPGQIEVFNWSASGSIILDSLAVSFPTVVLYVIDTERSRSPVSFMSNMMYACGVLFKTKLPFIVAFNKTDVQSPDECINWMNSYDSFAESAVNEGTYMGSLSRSCALAMNEFYDGIKSVGVSAKTGAGLEAIETALGEAKAEYYKEYLPWLETQREKVKKRRADLVEKSAELFKKDRSAAIKRLDREEAASRSKAEGSFPS